jgi:hypothetical protein
MFGFSKKKNKLQEQIEKDGIEYATDRFAEIISEMLKTRELAYQFILEKVEAASQGNEEAMKFASESGFLPSEYKDAMEKSCPEIDGANGPQQTLLNISMLLIDDVDLMVKFTIKVSDKIMKNFRLGKYENKDDRINCLMRLLKSILEDDAGVLPVLNSNIPVPTYARQRQQHFTRQNIESAKSIILNLSKLTDKNSEYIIRKALSLSSLKGGMRLEEAGVDILFIVRDNAVIYINGEADHLFVTDEDGYEKLDGRAVNFVFSGQSDGTVIEVFVAFDDSESYTMFTLKAGMMERLNYVAQAIFKCFQETGIKDVFSPFEKYATQYIYAFHLYKKDEKYFMVNNHQTQAYLIDASTILRDDVDEIKSIFWS